MEQQVCVEKNTLPLPNIPLDMLDGRESACLNDPEGNSVEGTAKEFGYNTDCDGDVNGECERCNVLAKHENTKGDDGGGGGTWTKIDDLTTGTILSHKQGVQVVWPLIASSDDRPKPPRAPRAPLERTQRASLCAATKLTVLRSAAARACRKKPSPRPLKRSLSNAKGTGGD